MITNMRSLFRGPSTSTEEPWKRIMARDKLNAEHLDKSGRYAPEADTVSNVWFGMTAELAREASRAEVEQERCSYKKVEDFIEQSREHDRRFAKRKLDNDVEMGMSSAAPGNGPIDPVEGSAESYNIPASPAPKIHSTPLVARAAVKG